MKVILYMAMAANGMIASGGGKSTFISKESWESLNKVAQGIGCVIYGRRSYDAEPIKGVMNVVLTHDKNLKSNKREFVFMAGAPRKILEKLKKQGYESVMVIGGGKTNTEFMKDNLIDEIYLDVEPTVFGEGVLLFAPADFEYELKLLEIKKLSPQTIQLHYKLIK